MPEGSSVIGVIAVSAQGESAAPGALPHKKILHPTRSTVKVTN